MSDPLQTGDLATLMDRNYRHQRHIYDLTREYYLLGRDRLVRDLKPPHAGSVLEIGCGTARNLIKAARQFPDARLYGVDISSEMLATARANVGRAGLGDRIVLARGDAAAFDAEALFGITCFDRVFFSYSLSMIPPWREALAHAAQLTASPGGRLSVVDFGEQDGLPAWFRSVLHAWLARFHVTPRADLRPILSDIAAATGGTLQFARLYRDYAVYAVISPQSRSSQAATGSDAQAGTCVTGLALESSQRMISKHPS